MQEVIGGTAWDGDTRPGAAPGAADFAAQMAVASQQFTTMQQQYLANLSRMTGAQGGGVPDMPAQMAAVAKQFTDLQQQYLAGLSS